MTTSVLRHSERTQECFVGIREGSNITQSEESVTLMTFYRFPHSGSRFFANMHNDAFCHLLKKEGCSNLKYFHQNY